MAELRRPASRGAVRPALLEGGPGGVVAGGGHRGKSVLTESHFPWRLYPEA